MIKYKTPNELSLEVKKYVVGQDEAVNQLSLFLFNYLLYQYSKYTDIVIPNAPVALLIGESGCGKTFMTRTLAKLMEFDLIEINAKSISQEGWEGTSLKKLLLTEMKQRPASNDSSIYRIIFIDEIDKFCQPMGSSTDDNYSIHLQNSLLKYLEGFKLEDSNLSVDLTKCCFILAGNFQQIRENRKSEVKSIGFSGANKVEKDKIIHELEAFGMIPEMIGRISNIIELRSLEFEDYMSLVQNENSYYKQYEKILLHLNIILSLTNVDLCAIIDKTLKLKIGVRGMIQELNKLINREIYFNQDRLSLVVEYFNYLDKAEGEHQTWLDKVSGIIKKGNPNGQ